MEPFRRMRRTPVLYTALAVAALAGALGVAAGRDTGVLRAGHSPGPRVPRLQGTPVTVSGISAVTEFDWYGDELYLLDPVEKSVAVLRAGSSGAWEKVRAFGRYGGGPGELLRPSGVARLLDPARVAVVDQSRLHLFDTLGVYVESLPIDVACALPLPRVAAGRRGIFIHGDCSLRPAAGDTVYAVLFWSADGRDYVEVARDARYTLDGRFGTIFGARLALTPGLDHHLFGTGVTNCLWRVAEVPTLAARRECGLQDRSFPLVLRPDTRRALESRPRGPVAAIPAAHAWYEERLPGEPDLVIRPFHEDSAVLRRADGHLDLAVLPLPRLVGCRASGCLHAEPLDGAVRLRLLPVAALRQGVGALQSPPAPRR